jgi:hypothetical protein
VVTGLVIRPRVMLVPACERSRGEECVEFARSAGLELDEWQQIVLDGSLGVTKRGGWASFESAMIVPRQNGKSAVLEARVLWGMFVLAEPLVIWSSHQRDTALESFRRLVNLIEENPDLTCQVTKTIRSHGEEGLELENGSRIRFRTRTGKSGRGFSADLLIVDEAHFTPQEQIDALMPTLSAKPNSQVCYAGSACDQQAHEHGVVLARLRERGHLAETGKRLSFFEWSVDLRDAEGVELRPQDVYDELVDDEDLWVQANPALGTRISFEHVRAEREAMDMRGWLVERLGCGDWPRTDLVSLSPIPPERWLALIDEESELEGEVVFAFDVSPDRRASIAAAGRRPDGKLHCEIIHSRPGTAWLIDELVRLDGKHHPVAVLVDSYGPAGSLAATVSDAGVAITDVTSTQHAAACGRILDLVAEDGVRHRGTDEVVAALRGARPRQLGDAWAWSRKNSAVDISPLVAVTLALWRADELDEWDAEGPHIY